MMEEPNKFLTDEYKFVVLSAESNPMAAALYKHIQTLESRFAESEKTRSSLEEELASSKKKCVEMEEFISKIANPTFFMVSPLVENLAKELLSKIRASGAKEGEK